MPRPPAKRPRSGSTGPEVADLDDPQRCQIDASDGTNVHSQSIFAQSPVRPAMLPQSPNRRVRGGTACQPCRLRKSKCDTQRPRCGACLRHDTQCDLDNDTPSLCHGVGPQLLDAVTDLTRLLRSHEAKLAAINTTAIPSDACPLLLTAAPTLTSDIPPLQPTPNCHLGEQVTDSAQQQVPIDEDHNKLARGGSCGFDAILAWKPIVSFALDLPSPVGVCGQEREPSPSSGTEHFDLSTLLRLTSKYLTGVHVKNPILDPVILHRYVIDVVQHGLDWSSEACLVCLVCALGAILGADSLVLPVTPGQTATVSLTSEPELALSMFQEASRRLGFAISQNNILAVQCACLTGIWHMCNVQPIKAWRFLSIASNIWCAVSSLCPFPLGAPSPSSGNDASGIERNLYFTIFRSESELRMELQLPTSALEGIELSTSFPQPPATDDSEGPQQQSSTTSRSWYFILAETSIRHLLNRLLRFQSVTHTLLDDRRITQMIKDAELFETQLLEWHRLLPHMFQFEAPNGLDLGEEPDELRFVLRYRFLACRDMLARPFVRLCVEHNLATIDPGLRQAVVGLASGCLRACMQKMTQVQIYRHQGLWFMIRTQAANVAILLAAAKAQSASDTRGAVALVLPEGWRDRVRDLMIRMEPCWADSEGQLGNIRTVLVRALADSP